MIHGLKSQNQALHPTREQRRKSEFDSGSRAASGFRVMRRRKGVERGSSKGGQVCS